MLLHPPVSEAEALAWLQAQAAAQFQSSEVPKEQLEAALKDVAQAMAAISAVVLPDELEPLFP